VTSAQAFSIWQLLASAYPTQVVEEPTQALYLDHFRALPWREGRTERAIRGLIARRAEPHLPAIGAVVQAAGVAPEAAHLLVEAMTTGCELVPDLASRTGWAVGAAATPVPPAPAEAPALPAPDVTADERRANLRRLGALHRDLGRGKTA
jgi:hypothetical protein